MTAYAAHKTQDHVRRAEQAGLPVVMVTVAGGEAFRRALLGWCEGKSQVGDGVTEPEPRPSAATR